MQKKVVKRESLTEQIKSILIDRIVDGELGPGDRLKELQIASEFGTSQAPVREAIRSLQALGYVEHKPHVGALVKCFNNKEIEEAYQIREALETHCLTHAPANVDQLTEILTTHLKAMESAVSERDIKTFSRADNLFHQSIVAFSGNNSMLSIWESLKIQMQVFATVVETSISIEELYALHPPIVAALKQKLNRDFTPSLSDHYREIESSWTRSK